MENNMKVETKYNIGDKVWIIGEEPYWQEAAPKCPVCNLSPIPHGRCAYRPIALEKMICGVKIQTFIATAQNAKTMHDYEIGIDICYFLGEDDKGDIWEDMEALQERYEGAVFASKKEADAMIEAKNKEKSNK